MRQFMHFLILYVCTVSSLVAQKKPLDHSVYDTWKRISTSTMSKDGKFNLYVVSAPLGDGYLVQHNLLTGASSTIDRGKAPSLTFDGKYAVCRISPYYEETDKARIAKKKADEMPKDTLCIWTLGQSNLTKYPFLSSLKMAEEGSLAIAFQTNPPADTSQKTKAPKRESGEGTDLMLYYFSTGKVDTIQHVTAYRFLKNGTQLFMVRKLNSKDKSDIQDGLYLYDLVSKSEQPLLVGARKSRFNLPSSDKNEQYFAFYANTDTIKASQKLNNIYFFTKGDTQATLMVDATIKGLPKDWIISRGNLTINKEGTRLFFYISPKPLEKDTTLIDSETAKLDVWHYFDDYVQPMQLKGSGQDAPLLSYLSIQNPQNGLVQLATPEYSNVQVPDDGSAEWAYASGNKPYRIQSQWEADNRADLYLIKVADGSASKIATGVFFSFLNSSPQGKYLVWYDKETRAWYSYEVATTTIRNITKGIDVAFWKESDDRPLLPNAYGSCGWRDGDAAFLVYDKYDIWEVDPAGVKAPVALTDGVGRKLSYTFKLLRISDQDNDDAQETTDVVKSVGTLYFTAFDNVTKCNGFYIKEQGRRQTQMQRLILDRYSFERLQRAKDGKVFTYVRSNFSDSPDLWVTHDQFKTQTQLSDINPQQKEYNWGTAELVQWTSVNGFPCDGILYKPEDFDPAKKYPMLINFYETKSNSLHSYIKPFWSVSIINISYYVSNGYLVFVPDIHYTIGHPGQSAMNCIMPGVDMLCKNPWVDEANMAIQGHSWGGYQVSYIITQTNRFKAAHAGAPVANMTSAYGGIRWGTGIVRQFQYESHQSRIGKNLWEGLDLYIENSPLFLAQNITTPLLILHNNKDGAVPWYQGIEYFTALRRLGKQVWMLQYNDEDHNLVERRNRKDLSIRLAQFFDHFLKGAPAPVWIKEGVPATKKGIDWGLEYK